MWRLPSESEDDRVIGMWRQLNTEDPAEDAPPQTYIERTLQALRREPWRGRFVVLDVDGHVVGYALLIHFWSNEQGGDVCVIDELYVAPAARARGGARVLVAAIAAGEAPIWPSRPAAVQLEVSPRNTRARALYERLGFGVLRNTTMRLLNPSADDGLQAAHAGRAPGTSTG